MSAAGEDVTSDSSDATPPKAGSRHWLLHHKLSLDEGTSRDKAASERTGGRLGRHDQSCKNSVRAVKST